MDIGFAYLLRHKLLKENNNYNEEKYQGKKIGEDKELYLISSENKSIHKNKCCERCGQMITFCYCSNISSNKS